MSDKRFLINSIGVFHDNHHALHDLEVVDLLNEQDEKIIGLEKENSLFKEIFQEMVRQINVEIPPENSTKYSGIFIFTAEQFYLLKELTKEK